MHDLEPLLDQEARRIPLTTPIVLGWGQWPSQPPRRSLRLGSCREGSPPTVRIHPVLDHGDVPEWFVGFIVHHELLHVRHPPLKQGARRVVHPRSFMQAERRHPLYAEATAWEAANIHALLRRARTHVLARRRNADQ